MRQQYDKGATPVTLRAIAADAGVNPAMIIRHFGSKADLFGASVQLGFDTIDLAGVRRNGIGREFIRRTGRGC